MRSKISPAASFFKLIQHLFANRLGFMDRLCFNLQGSPRMTPSSSTEKLKTVSGTTGASAKKLYSKEDSKGSSGRLGSQSPMQITAEVSAFEFSSEWKLKFLKFECITTLLIYRSILLHLRSLLVRPFTNRAGFRRRVPLQAN